MTAMTTPTEIAALSDTDIHFILTDALAKLLKHIDLTDEHMEQVMLIIMQGRCPDALMGAILIALREKGESIGEITSCAKIMLKLADTITINDRCAVDIVGTGGDGANLFNVSTAAAFVAAAAGVTVAKHGNRGVSTSSGSSDVLSQAGVKLDISKELTRRCINEQGIGFLFAPNHHPAMKHAIGVRRQLKVRTIFNILGPLTNPAHVKRAVIGVFSPELCQPLAQVFANLGLEHVFVVHSQDGLDEFSLATGTHVAELKDGKIDTRVILPEDVGLPSQTLIGLMVNGAEESLNLIKNALSGKSDDPIIQKAQNMIALNAGAAIYVAGRASSHAKGVAIAKDTLDQGLAWQKLQEFAKATQA